LFRCHRKVCPVKPSYLLRPRAAAQVIK
jgi:hypothetical protein